MRQPTVTERLAKLENQMQRLLGTDDSKLESLEPGPDEWKLTAGIFNQEDGMDEVFEEALKLREAERSEFHRK